MVSVKYVIVIALLVQVISGTHEDLQHHDKPRRPFPLRRRVTTESEENVNANPAGPAIPAPVTAETSFKIIPDEESEEVHIQRQHEAQKDNEQKQQIIKKDTQQAAPREDQQQPSVPTEAAEKTPNRFRTNTNPRRNDELLASLKRRRQQRKHTTTSTQSPEEIEQQKNNARSVGARRRAYGNSNSRPAQSEDAHDQSVDSATTDKRPSRPRTPSTFQRSSFRGSTTTSTQDPGEITGDENSNRKSKSYFSSRRRGNKATPTESETED